jgi:hypothetical protein
VPGLESVTHDHPEQSQLHQLVTTRNLSETDFQSLAYRLSPQQRRLFELLAAEGEADTITVRNRCSIGNVSAVAIELSAKLEAAGDPRRVMCNLEPHDNRFGERGVLGRWRFVYVGAAANDEQQHDVATR